MRKVALLICALGISCTMAAQSNHGSWANVAKLSPGQKIQVVETNKTKHSGTLVSVSESAIVLSDAAGSETVPKESVKSVQLVKNHRMRNALIGMGVGAGAGAGIGAAAWESNGFFGSKAVGAGVVAVLGGLGGLAIGALLPTHHTIYDAP